MPFNQCAVLNCVSSERRSFYRFPNPKRDMDSFLKWVVATGNPKLKDPMKVDVNKYRICGKHFPLDVIRHTKRIRKDIVPTLMLPDALHLDIGIDNTENNTEPDLTPPMSFDTVVCIPPLNRSTMLMADKEEFTLNNAFLKNPNIKEEIKDHNCYIDVSETSINANETELKGIVWGSRIKEYEIANTVNDIKMEKEISPDDVKIEFDNKLLFCDHCEEYYDDYCTRCGMLEHILNGVTLSVTDGRAIKEIPSDILEIRELSGHVGVFALKVIPEGVKMGPFNGLSTSECPRRLKGGKFIASEDKSKLLNWMQYINPAKNMFQQNLIPFQRENKLYYHCNREILVGEELLVYFGEEYEDSIHKNLEMDFIAPTEDDVKDVFACIPCCLGFSSQEYLGKHKSTCPNETNGKFSIDEITQCPFCKIYLYQKEYLECHMSYYCQRNVRGCTPPILGNQIVDVNIRKTHQMYKCTQCKYKTSYKSFLRSHLNKHYEVKMYRCEICSWQFKTKRSLKLHLKYNHIDVEGKVGQMASRKVYMQANTEARSSKVIVTHKINECD